MTTALQVLQQRFGYNQFRHQQKEIIDCLIQGEDALVLMPTGGGKSLCYQIPAIVRPGVGIVISPLIALMQDQVDALALNDTRAAYLNSSQSPDQQAIVRQQLLNNELELLYIAPERAMTEEFLQLLQKCQIALIAIDEAHCVSQWGHDFRRDYQSLYRLHERFPAVPRIALTATADRQTHLEIESQLKLQQARTFIHSFDRPNIFYRISEGSNNRQRLWQFIERHHPQDAGIVYCLSRKQVEKTAEWLRGKGRTALPYHAGLDKKARRDHQQRFLRQDGIIIVATIAFGMGIDKPDVRFVAHLSLPRNIESYYQETGRAGRDGQPANAWLAYGLQDIITLRGMAMDSDADERYKRHLHHKLEAMLGLCEQSHCRRQTILNYFDEISNSSCGHCDNCLNPPQTWDATEACRMALSCVYRSGQRFGVNYVIDVLLGKRHERILRNQHDQLSTFGIGTSLDSAEWHSLFRQLIALGYLNSDMDSYGALKLDSSCKPLLKGEKCLHLRKLDKDAITTKSPTTPKSKVRIVDQALFEALREYRRDLAEQQGVPPYVILHDKTLHEICRVRPTLLAQMNNLPGIGVRKLQLYGEELLRIVKQHPANDILDNELSNTVNETLQLFSHGIDPQQIAERRDLGITTIYNHLAAAIEVGQIKLDEVISLPKAQLDQIIYSMEMAMIDEPFQMKNVFEHLNKKYDYGLLNCIKASIAG